MNNKFPRLVHNPAIDAYEAVQLKAVGFGLTGWDNFNPKDYAGGK